MTYYKDRDFPEVKTSNSDIVAVIPNPDHLERVIRDYNELEEAFTKWKQLAISQHIVIVDQRKEIAELRKALMKARETIETNHKWHEEYDDVDGYPGSDLFNENAEAMGLIDRVLASK